jgi:hypothetical protein
MLPSGAHVSIGGVEYVLADQERPYIHRYESLFSQSTAIAGEIAKNQLRPEKLLWSLTDFSGGEGSPIYYPQDPNAYDIASGMNVVNAGLLTTRPRRRVTSVARSGSTAQTGHRPAGSSTWDKAVIAWGDNGLFSRDTLGWQAGTGQTSFAGVNLFSSASDGRYLISGVVVDGPSSSDILTSIDGAPATPTYADVFSGTSILNSPYVVAVLDGVWYAWGIDGAASNVLGLIKGAALSTSSAGTLIYNSVLIPQGAWGSEYWTDMVAAQGQLFMSFGTPSGSVVYTSQADVGRTFYTSEPGFCIKKLVYKLGVLFCIGAQVSAGKKFASIYAIPLQTESPIEIGSPRKHKNTELPSWEAGCAGPGNTLFLADCRSGKIFSYDMKRDSFSLFDDLANAGTGDGMDFVPAGNLLSYGTSSMEAASLPLTGWTQTAGSATLTTGTARNGNRSLFFTGVGPVTTSTATGVAGVPVSASTSYTATAYARVSSGANGTWTVAIRWYTSTGAFISTTTGTGVAGVALSWVTFTCTATSPSNAAYAAVVVSNAGNSNANVDDVSLTLTGVGTDEIAFLAMHGSRLFGATWEPQGVGTSLQVFSYDDSVKENRDASQAIAGSLESGEWDFGVPQEQKALIGFYVTYEVTDAATLSGLSANTRITVSYATDEGISVTPSYTALDTVTSATEVIHKGRHFIPVSDADTTVSFSRLKIKIALDNNATAAAPPIVYSVVAEAQLMAYAETWDLVVKVEDEESGSDHPRSRQNRASFMRDNLLDLAINKQIVSFVDGTRVRFNDTPTEHTVMVEDPTDIISSPDTAEGYMALKLRAVPT